MTDMLLPPDIALDDPRPTAAEAPYTFFLPHPEEIAALQPGDEVKAIFRQTAGDPKYERERMWVEIETIADGMVSGPLVNTPVGMDRIALGDQVRIPITHIIGTSIAPDHEPPQLPKRREYWDRCFVDDCVMEGRSRIDYIYREAPDMGREGDTFPDSGWRIRGTEAGVADDRARGEHPHYIAIGSVLNVCDNWIDLVDAPVGSAYGWWEERGCWHKFEDE